MQKCCHKYAIVLFIILMGGTLWFFSLPIKGRAQTSYFASTSVEVKLSCGDGFAEHISGEVCDPGNPPDISADLGTSTCQDFNDIYGDPFASGDLYCLSDCSNFATSSCYTCGNGHKEAVEECDQGDLGGLTCVGLGYQSGVLSCTLDCRINNVNCVPMEDQPSTPGAGSSGGSAGGPSGFLPGSETETETKVIMKGKSYPNSDVHILADGRVIGIVKTDTKADFYFETSEMPAGIASFGFWSEDEAGLKSTLLTLTIRVISGAVTTISGIYISPTIDVDKQAVRQGEDIAIYGQTVPDTQVFVHINSDNEIVEQTNSHEESGSWKLVFNTTPLAEDFHTAKAFFQVNVEGNVIKSGFSKSVSFHVGKVGGEAACPGADLNHDGRVNLTDFSILLYYWGTDNECADQDQSGNVDLVDFSIMMFYWTG